MAYGKRDFSRGGGNTRKFEQKDGTGVLFVNDKKETEKQPNYTGNIMIDGTKYRLAAWLKSGNKGKYLSLCISDFTSNAEGSNNNQRSNNNDDENPFV